MKGSFFEQIAKKKLIDNDDDLIQASLKMIRGGECGVQCTVLCITGVRRMI